VQELTNLLEETVEVLTENGKTPADVQWVGSPAGWFTWEEFVAVAEHANYSAGFGSAQVAQDLVVVGDGFWLERAEYDGSEWWAFKTTIARPKLHKQPDALTIEQAEKAKRDLSCGWEPLDAIAGWAPSITERDPASVGWDKGE
jgi:hypothetical protein